MLVALVNSASLVVVSFFIFYEAFRRLQHPEAVHAGMMISVAAAGVVMNGVIALLLYRSGGDVNIRSALLHEVGDTLSTAAVIAGGWAIMATGQNWIDPALSIGIGALILWSSFGIVRETLNILLEGTPRGIELKRVEAAMRAIEGVNDVHDLHVWSIGSETRALSCHIAIEIFRRRSASASCVTSKPGCMHEFHIEHTTIQFETCGLRSSPRLRDAGERGRTSPQPLSEQMIASVKKYGSTFSRTASMDDGAGLTFQGSR